MIPSINASGRYFNSKFRASKAGLINPARSARFQKRRMNAAPGPGQYKKKALLLSSRGEYFFSKYKGSQCRTFSRGARNPLDIKNNGTLPPGHGHGHGSVNLLGAPGPGYYRIPSDFGYYESKKLRRTSTAIKKNRMKKKRNTKSQSGLRKVKATAL